MPLGCKVLGRAENHVLRYHYIIFLELPFLKLVLIQQISSHRLNPHF